MLREWWQTLGRLVRDLVQRFRSPRAALPAPVVETAAAPKSYGRLERIVLTDSVCRTLFDDFAAHRRGTRGQEEIGWFLLGVREEDHAVALATLPAGAQRSAGVAHVQFNSEAQAIASRILRQKDKRLVHIGVVHTHPGSLRHPSDGDWRGDSAWVTQLRGGEGVFGIGTADVRQPASGAIAQAGEKHQQILGELCFSWYALGRGERRYRRMQVDLALGPDLARPLHPLWSVLEEHADALERLVGQQKGASLQVLPGKGGSALSLELPLVEPESALQVVLDARETRYFLHQGRQVSTVDPEEERVDRAVYLVLAELAKALSKTSLGGGARHRVR
jgi:proteasome lid subunit RPN8/RPN11